MPPICPHAKPNSQAGEPLAITKIFTLFLLISFGFWAAVAMYALEKIFSPATMTTVEVIKSQSYQNFLKQLLSTIKNIKKDLVEEIKGYDKRKEMQKEIDRIWLNVHELKELKMNFTT